MNKALRIISVYTVFSSSGAAVSYKEVIIGKGVDDDTFAEVAVDLEEGYPIRLIKD